MEIAGRSFNDTTFRRRDSIDVELGPDQKASMSCLREQTAGLSAMALEEGISSYQNSFDEGFCTPPTGRPFPGVNKKKYDELFDELEEPQEPTETDFAHSGRSRLSHILGSSVDESSPLVSRTSRRRSSASMRSSPVPRSSRRRSSASTRSITTVRHAPKYQSPIYSDEEEEEDEEEEGNGGDTLPSSGNNSCITDPFPPIYNTFIPPSVPDVENQIEEEPARRWTEKLEFWYRGLTKEKAYEEFVKAPVRYLPSVVLGTLLNILDGLSYGIILFPLGTPLFSHLGPAGLSMFYVSCIVAQLVYSLGGSVFRAGAGGEMIEVVPFFHSMAMVIMADIGEDRPDSVIATTIVAFAVSSVITGMVFFFLGYARLGSLIGFFPRHILVGCIGGVGYFLVITGLEVTSQIGTIFYRWETLKLLFSPEIVLKWLFPLGLALLLLVIQRFNHHPLILPAYFIAVFIAFHFVVWIVPSLSLVGLRESGWIFSPPAVSEPWYSFYKLYKFSEVSWLSVMKTIPAMFALTFFGILHVPINVPALASSIGEDHIDVNRELVAHGISNALSGFMGSIQNYLVYTNSLLFIKSGADSRVAGVMLAISTFFVMISGPSLIGFIPIPVVGALIFLLGIELVKEAVYDTYGRLSRFEYFTIVVIVITMGAWDFVYGILAGIVLACVSFVIQASRTSAIRATYTGEVARSTVRRHAVQRKFLEQVGEQIYVMKLTGSIFFGTIVHVEETVRRLLDEANFGKKPIRYLVLDIRSVTDIDFSAAEAFARMNRLLRSKGVFMLLCGATEDVKVMEGLKAIRLWDNNDSVRLFANLNLALEWCENESLGHYYRHRKRWSEHSPIIHEIPASSSTKKSFLTNGINTSYGVSPRESNLMRATERTIEEDLQQLHKWSNFNPPLPVMMQTFQGYSNKTEDFWFQVAPYFKKEELKAGTILYESNNEATGFYLVESGILRADYHLAQGHFFESILAGTTCGELPFFSGTSRTATVSVEVDAVVWKLDRASWDELRNSRPNGENMANELLEVALKLTVERFTSVTSYVLMSAS
ncbi:hypothetical protein TRVA0_009S01068 [Trichomonascus vanleenenianus]|uniref:Vsb1p n=1 Tax=Trichomonascus vanleenenianus TaxID=2268995 RepID=UPI003ECA55E5